VPLIIPLNEAQTEALAPLFERCKNAAGLGLPGMLVAQPYRRENGEGFLRVGWLPNAKARLLVEQATHPDAPDEGPIPPGVGE
jgi:hypothetical protein